MEKPTAKSPSIVQMGTLNIKLVHGSDLRNLKPAQLLPNTHFIQGGLNVVFGSSGSYKSFYVLDHCLRLAQDDPVVYIAAEGGPGIGNRLDAWCNYYGKTIGHLWCVCREIDLLDRSMVTSLINAIGGGEGSPKLVVFDTYARCIPGGDENSARDTGLAIASVTRIQRELQTAVNLVHHTNRAERGERGSGALRGAADSMIEMANVNGEVKIKCSKMKDWEPWPTEKYRFQTVTIGDGQKSGVLVPESEVKQGGLTIREMEILEFLSLESFSTWGADTKTICEALNIPVSTIYNVLSRLKTTFLVVQDKKGTPWSISEYGKIRLKNSTTDQGVGGQVLGFPVIKT